jgi:putative hemolysin
MSDEHFQQHFAPNVEARTRRTRPNLSVGLATSEREILDAKKLRWRVFADELGARLPSRTPGVDHDFYDPYCQHLIARDEASGEVVGTYRILTPEAAHRIGGYYTEDEFDLVRLAHLKPYLVEIGRSCVHPDYRTGATITLLWAGLARFMTERQYRYLVGCASVGMADGGRNAVALHDALAGHLAPAEYRVTPRNPLPLDALREPVSAEIPPLLKGYLRAGSWICGAPAWDPDFNTADFPILLSMDRLDGRYAKHFQTSQGN